MTRCDTGRISAVRFRQTIRPLRTLFRTSLGSKSVATSILIEVGLDGGAGGLGEAPTSFVVPHETPAAIRHVLIQARKVLAGANIEDYPQLLAELRGRFGNFHMTLAGLEVALFRARLARTGQSELKWWGGRSSAVETDITVTFIPDPASLVPWIRRAAKIGFRTYKVKVSGDPAKDAAFVEAVRDQIRAAGVERFIIRLDGNQGYSAETYRRMIDKLGRAGIEIELFEQPLPAADYAGLRKIAGFSPVPVILDETVFDADACGRAIAEKLGDGVNVKIAKSGIAGSAEIVRLARSAGLKLMVGCMTETMVGLSAGVYMAAGTGAFDYVDLDAAHLMFNVRRHGAIEVAGPRYVLEDVPARPGGRTRKAGR